MTLILMGFLILTLIVLYISKETPKTKKGKINIIGFSFVLFCGISTILLIIALYEENVIMKHNWFVFNSLSLILILLYVMETFEIFDKLPHYGSV